MLPLRYEKLYTPPSSPASISSAWPNSSSPPSSPGRDPLYLDSDDEDEPNSRPTRVIDPLAGSYNANRSKRNSTIFTPPCSPSKKRRFAYRPPDDDNDTEEIHSFSFTSGKDIENTIWEDALDTVFKTGKRNIDLSSCNLTHIPPRVILDLSKMVVLPESVEAFDDTRITISSVRPTEVNVKRTRAFARFQTAPASTSLAWASSEVRQKSASSNHVLNDTSREHVDLYLGNNNITKLPNELWSLRNLRILSLRSNGIIYLPPEIAILENLVDLNVAFNRLSFLPSELNKVKNLEKLIVLPNPFIPDPHPESLFHVSVSEARYIGSQVPPLTELALRSLLARPTTSFSSTPILDTLLEDMYELPIRTGADFRPISAPLRRTLAICVPGSIATDEDDILSSSKPDDQDATVRVSGIGRCPNPAHGGMRSVFVQHVEERYTWVDSVAGIKLGGIAPLRWRGCERGCLDFLRPVEEILEEAVQGGGQTEEDVTAAVQTVQFGATELDFED